MSEQKNTGKSYGKTPYQKNDEPLSLYGMDPEDALKKALGTPPKNKPVYCPKCQKELTGLAMIEEKGEIRCPECGLLATYENKI